MCGILFLSFDSTVQDRRSGLITLLEDEEQRAINMHNLRAFDRRPKRGCDWKREIVR
jgi:hypothetical protein